MKDIAKELQRIVFDAAGPIKPGMGIKAQINAACDNLEYQRGFWRVRDAWYGTAKNWTGEAIFDLMDRYHRYLAESQDEGESHEPAVVYPATKARVTN